MRRIRIYIKKKRKINIERLYLEELRLIQTVNNEISLYRCDMKEINASIIRGEGGGEEKEKERKEKESVYTEIFSILNKNGLGKGKTDLKTI